MALSPLRRRLLRTLPALLPMAAAAEPKPLILVVDSATAMPMARIQRDAVVGGMTLELGQLIASELGVPLRAIARPRRRLLGSLSSGEAHMVCTYLSAWLSGPLQWSRPFFRHSDVIVSRADARRPAQLGDLLGQPIGTVLGFVYPELQTALGLGFVREDAPDAEANLRKLAAGRIQHAVISERLLHHLQQQAVFRAPVHPPLALTPVLTQCALGPQAPVTLEALNRAIERVQRDGQLDSLYRRYDGVAEPSTRSRSRP